MTGNAALDIKMAVRVAVWDGLSALIAIRGLES